jgi:alkanesulfonate monooxygenase SsuD/methylene tetrahydromethanopterin reductase-like flavin-dependent oxidoreductase (luciferase family)
MKYAIAIRNMGPQSTRETIRSCARVAEQLGFDALFVSDHLCIPPDDIEGSGGRYLDVLATLAYLAGATDRIRLGVSVLVLPYRPAVLTAKQVATIQELSGARMILGVGVGWMKREFEALSVDKRMRGRISNETLRVLRHLFGTQAQAYRGDLVSFPRSSLSRAPHVRQSGSAATAIPQLHACSNSATDGIRCCPPTSSNPPSAR